MLSEYNDIVNEYGEDENGRIMKGVFNGKGSLLLLIHETKFYFCCQYKLLLGSFVSNMLFGRCKEYAHFMNNIALRKYVCDNGCSMFKFRPDGSNKYINEFIDYVQHTLEIYGADEDSSTEDGDTKTYKEVDGKTNLTDSCIQELVNYIENNGKLPEQITSKMSELNNKSD